MNTKAYDTYLLRHFIIILMLIFTTYAFPQSTLKLSAGPYLTSDAGLWYYGVSGIANSEYTLNESFGVNFYLQYFQVYNKMDRTGIKAWSTGLVGHLYLGARKKFYLGVGIAYERMYEYGSALYPYYSFIDRKILLPVYRIGREFELKNFCLSPEIHLTGPYFPDSNTTEIFTLPSIGVRIRIK